MLYDYKYTMERIMSIQDRYFSDSEWNKKLQELQYKYENKNKTKFKEFRDSIGEIIDRRLVIKDEALEAFRIGKSGERLEKRLTKLSAPERLYRIEVEESLCNVLDGLISIYNALPKQVITEEEKDFLSFLRDKATKMKGNLYHKKDRLSRPEVYTDINHRYDFQKRTR